MYKIVARRWFQKSYGNTYHSVRIFDEDNNLIAHEPMAYGYDEGYLQTAHALFQAKGIYPTTDGRFASGMNKDYHDFMQDKRDNKFFITCTDVERQKDL